MDDKTIAPWIKALSKFTATITVISLLMAIFIPTGDIHKISILIFGVGLSAIFTIVAIACLIMKTVPGFISKYGRVSPTHQKTKPVQFILCIFLFISTSILLLFCAIQKYAELYPS